MDWPLLLQLGCGDWLAPICRCWTTVCRLEIPLQERVRSEGGGCIFGRYRSQLIRGLDDRVGETAVSMLEMWGA
jgi:hypothetical protein